MRHSFLCLCCALLNAAAFADGIELTSLETAFTLLNRYDRSFLYGAGGGAQISASLNDAVFGGAGIAVQNQSELTTLMLDSSFDAALRMIPYAGKYLHALAFLYYELMPVYDAAALSLIPAIGVYGWDGRAGIVIGHHARWSRFWEFDLYETLFSFRAFVMPLRKERGFVRVVWSNYDVFSAENSGGWYLGVDGRYAFNKRTALASSVKLHQSGGAGLLTVFYGVSASLGVNIIWK